jgi:hypothetical protein
VEIWKTREVTIQRDPLTAGLDSQGSEPGIWNQVSPGIRCGTEARKDIPVPLAWLNNNAARLFKQDLTEVQHFIKAAGLCEYLRVGGEADYAAEDLPRHAITRITVDNAI